MTEPTAESRRAEIRASLDEARACFRELLHGHERRAANGRALVFEPAPEELQLLPKPELPDRAVRDGALAIVAAAGGGLHLFVPLLPQRRELPLGAGLRELVGLSGSLREGHSRRMLAGADPFRCRSASAAWPGPNRFVAMETFQEADLTAPQAEPAPPFMRQRKRCLGPAEYHAPPWPIA